MSHTHLSYISCNVTYAAIINITCHHTNVLCNVTYAYTLIINVCYNITCTSHTHQLQMCDIMSIINVQNYHVNINKNIFFGKIQSQILHQFYSENNHLTFGWGYVFF